MKRSTFLKRLLSGLAIAPVLPKVVESIDIKPTKKKKGNYKTDTQIPKHGYICSLYKENILIGHGHDCEIHFDTDISQGYGGCKGANINVSYFYLDELQSYQDLINCYLGRNKFKLAMQHVASGLVSAECDVYIVGVAHNSDLGYCDLSLRLSGEFMVNDKWFDGAGNYFKL